jgi:hypothetical protein
MQLEKGNENFQIPLISSNKTGSIVLNRRTSDWVLIVQSKL